jgi:Ca-activated chloride channel family protein
LWTAAPATTSAQTESGTGEGPVGIFSEVVEVGSVLVPVVVRDDDGRYLTGLDRRDFHLLVDGVEVPIETFERRAEAPISVVVLQDLSGSMATGGRLEASREAVSYLLAQARPGDELAMASFAGGALAVDVPFTQSLTAVAEAMTLWRAYGTTTLHDAVAWLPEIGFEGRHPKRAAILLTDGADNASTLSPYQARAIVRRAQLPVYVLGFDSGDPYRLDPDGHKVHRYADVLNLLGSFTGGRYLALEPDADIAAVMASILAELRSQYVLSFRMQNGGERRNFDLEVKLSARDARKATVSTRQGYRGTPPAAWPGQR